jgi:hypothetical protein
MPEQFKSKLNNYAFIDSQNLNLSRSLNDLSQKLGYKKEKAP